MPGKNISQKRSRKLIWQIASENKQRLWASCQIRKIAGCACAGNAGNAFSPPPTSKETASKRSRHASRHVRHARAVMHVGIAYPRWRGKRSRHSRRMRTRNYTYLVRGPYRLGINVLNPYHKMFLSVRSLRNQPMWCLIVESGPNRMTSSGLNRIVGWDRVLRDTSAAIEIETTPVEGIRNILRSGDTMQLGQSLFT